MDFNSIINGVNSKEDFMNFLVELRRDKELLPFNKAICVGLDKEFADAIDEFFKEYPLGKLPSGTIEILSGGYDEVGSSNVALKKAMELLVFIFQHIDELSDNELKGELLRLI